MVSLQRCQTNPRFAAGVAQEWADMRPGDTEVRSFNKLTLRVLPKPRFCAAKCAAGTFVNEWRMLQMHLPSFESSVAGEPCIKGAHRA
jgi:hypothetical protein